MALASSAAACTLILGLRDDYHVGDAGDAANAGDATDAGFDAPPVVPWVLPLRSDVNDVKVQDVEIDPATGDVGVAGYFTKTLDLGGGVTLTGGSTYVSAFFLRLDAQGHVLWKATMVGTSSDYKGNAIAFGNGEMAVTASGFSDKAYDVFGNLASVPFTCGYSSMVSRVAANGTAVRPTKAFCGGSFRHLVYAESGNLAGTGLLFTPNDFAPDGGNLPYRGAQDVLVMLIAPDDSLLWSRSFGTSDYDYGVDVAFGTDQAVYVVGATNTQTDDAGVEQTIAFDDAGTAGGLGFADGFLIRLDGTSGAATKVVSIAGASVDEVQGIFNAGDHVVVSGSLTGVGNVGSTFTGGANQNLNFLFASVDYAGNVSGVNIDQDGVPTVAGPAVLGAGGTTVLPILATMGTSQQTLTLGSTPVTVPADNVETQIGLISSWPGANVLALPPLVAAVRNTRLLAAVHQPTGNLVVAGEIDRPVQLLDAGLTPMPDDAGGTLTAAFVMGYGKWP